MLNISPTKDAYLGAGQLYHSRPFIGRRDRGMRTFRGQNDPNYIGNGASASLEEN
jgi:hypothetical protein